MPRLRTGQPFGLIAAINATIERLHKEGWGAKDIIDTLNEQYKSIGRKSLAAIANKHLAAVERAEDVLERNMGQFTNLGREYGCGDAVYLTMSFNFTNEGTGERKRYFDIVRVDTSTPRMRLGDVLRQGIQGLLESAEGNDYQFKTRFGQSLRDMIDSGRLRLYSIDC